MFSLVFVCQYIKFLLLICLHVNVITKNCICVYIILAIVIDV